MRRSLQIIDYKISVMSEMAIKNHELLKDMNSFFENISDATIREYYSKYGETMFDLDLKYFRVNVSDNLESIIKMKGTPYFSSSLKPRQIKQLDESEKLARDNVEILRNIENIIKNIIEKRLNKAIMGTLQDLARENVKKHNILPENERQSSVIYEDYSAVINKDYDNNHGGFRNRKNKTNNKKYAKKTTYKRPKKRVSKKNKTRKMKNNYL
jgi:hypothetical protein